MISVKDVFLHLTSGPGLMDNICNFIIRPPRSNYSVRDLGPDIFRIGDKGTERFMRQDFELENMRGMRLCCSWFKPYPTRRVPCVVYCHENCGGRCSGLEAIFLLEEGFSLFCFDFCGCGMSEGEYTSLGFYERQDLVAVIEFLMLKGDEVDGVALWGRSMGAVAAIMYASKDPWIRCIVCDSPFASLRLLIDDLVERHGGRAARAVPKILLRGIVESIRKRIMRRAAFDIDDLNSVKYANACHVPALLLHGADDDFVSPAHSELIRDAFRIPCLQQFTPGGHNDERDADMQKLISAFLHLYLVDKPQGARDMQALREMAVSNAAAAAAVADSTGTDTTKAVSSERSASASRAPKQPQAPTSYSLRCVAAASMSSSTTSAPTSTSAPLSARSSSALRAARGASPSPLDRAGREFCSAHNAIISSETAPGPARSSPHRPTHPGSPSETQGSSDAFTAAGTAGLLPPSDATVLLSSSSTEVRSADA
ncbi:hypothetical protein JKF63_02836 [Porcisia hertigi]|uniref:Serine aminopeptidase S33 domain-containing protein n=1 Tax=Porcisia hertigi TaxID=2761500 RepID=A0A836IMC1_9TRYP|nr:hypothetical protein JKF63_02836 [Porcisia hertigi]